MKHTKHNAFRRIAAVMLTLAVALTGISFGDTMTAQAKDRTGLENFADLENTTVTMKVGDTKGIDFVKYLSATCVSDYTDDYDWTSSDESVVSLVKEYALSVAGNVKVDYFVIKGEKPGTAVITGYNDYADKTVSFNVTVKAKKMTAKQKKCRHSWKTTQKATCLMSGMKTCKKCKLEKVIAKKDHKFVTTTETKVTYKQYLVYVCNGCTSDDPETRLAHDSTRATGICTEVCGAEFSQKKYGSVKAAEEAYWEHCEKYAHSHSTAQTIEYGEPESTLVTVKRCKICKNTPEAVEKYYK